MTEDDRESLYDAMVSFTESCGQPNWDCYGALPFTGECLPRAKRFIEALPSWVPVPDVCPENDGAVAFEWEDGKDWLLSVSVHKDRIVWAAILDDWMRTGTSDDPLSIDLWKALMRFSDRRQPAKGGP